MNVRRKRQKGTSTPPTNLDAFRTAERLFKSRSRPPPVELAFDSERVVWDARELDGPRRGVWTSGTGVEEVCYQVSLEGLSESEMGQSRWKGKAKAKETEEQDYAVIIPRIPGLVFFPSIIPERLQRALVIESLENAKEPNVTSLTSSYELPEEGLWSAWLAGRGNRPVARKDHGPSTSQSTSERLNDKRDDSTSTSEPSMAEVPTINDVKAQDVEIRHLLPRLRWSNVGYHYNWTTKLYDFDRPYVPIPPRMLNCCRTLARTMPWQYVFPKSVSYTGTTTNLMDEEWKSWQEGYEPDAGIVNFYQARDNLMGHTDHSEEDSVQPLVSLSLGLSSIFLVGGLTKDVAPLAILLRSGDGLIMSGRQGRRAYHGLPRVLEDTLPDYLRARPGDTGLDENMFAEDLDQEEQVDDWQEYGRYLERGSRININLRSGTRGEAGRRGGP